MVSYGYTLDHIAPKRTSVRARSIKPFPMAVCAAVILGSSAMLWTVLFEAMRHAVL
jgi:hypothetical protein